MFTCKMLILSICCLKILINEFVDLLIDLAELVPNSNLSKTAMKVATFFKKQIPYYNIVAPLVFHSDSSFLDCNSKDPTLLL